jgi:hypothetical protein
MTDFQRPTTDPTGSPASASPESETTAVPVPTTTIEPPPTAPTSRKGRFRAFAAMGLIGLVVASTAVATLVLTSSSTTSTALGYVPTGSVAYGELRLDLPGDQRQNVAEFLSKFPGFADQAALDTKLDEVLDRLVSDASDGKQTFTQDIKPWFDGQIGFAAGPLPALDAADPAAAAKDAHGVLLVSIKDAALARTWFTSTLSEAGATGTPETYDGTELIVFGTADMPAKAAFAVADDKVVIVGDVASVKAAIDTNGSSAVATSEPVKAAQASLAGDDLGFMFVDVRSLVTAATEAAGASASPIPEAFLAIVPDWVAGRLRVEGDAVRVDAINPHEDAAPGPNDNHANGVAGFAPPTSVALVAGNDVGATITEWIELLEQEPSLAEAYQQIEQAVGMLGGFDGLVGWMGDTGVVVNTAGDTLEGGIVSIPADAAQARQLFTTLRSFLALGGSQAGITVTDETYNGQTITVVDLGSLRDLAGLAGALGGGDAIPANPSELPDEDIRLAYVVTDEVVAIGSSPDFIKHVLDAGAGASLADDARFKGLVERAGGAHRAVTFLDVAAIRGKVEDLMATSASAQERAEYEESVKPFLVPFDAVITTNAVDDGLDQQHTVMTVK